MYADINTFSGVMLKPRFPNAFLSSSNETGAQPMFLSRKLFLREVP